MAYQRLHHIGIILPSTEAVAAFIKQYDLEIAGEGETPYQAHCIFTKAREGESPIEFLIPKGGPLAAFNEGRGGIHHICYVVDSIEQTESELRAMGCKLLENQFIVAENNAKINFIRPGSSFGVLVELMELP
ncbi:MAG: VOC family protein [Firmicutes bacterium]|nr:VOC family protein [Bacillota bacterium]